MAHDNWNTNGPLTNPADGTVLAEFQNLPDDGSTRDYTCTIIISSTVKANILLQRRDHDNTVTLTEQLIKLSSADATVFGTINDITLATGEHLRLVTQGLIVGIVSGSLITIPV
jgi:hypothetical protein